MKHFLNILKGLVIGGSMSVPGVSGGTMAMLLGCYSDLIHAVSSFTKNIKKNAVFLIELAVGGGIGLLLLSKLVEQGLAHASFGSTLRCLFVGLVLGGLPLMFQMTKSASKEKARNTDYLFAALGFALVLLLTQVPENILNLASSQGLAAALFWFIAGFIVAVGLVLPGISAMGMLAALGLFEAVNNMIARVFDLLKGILARTELSVLFSDANGGIRSIIMLVPLGIGGLVGIFATTRTIEKLMDNYPRKTYLLIIGFVLGSVIQVLPEHLPQGLDYLLWPLAAVLGFAAIMLLGRFESKQDA